VGLGAVDELGDEGARAVELGDDVEVVAIEVGARAGAVALFADAAVVAVDDVVDDGAVGQSDSA
jgi:hypothetical protein